MATTEKRPSSIIYTTLVLSAVLYVDCAKNRPRW